MNNVANKNEQRYIKAIKALEQLICAKDYKDHHGRGGPYEEMRDTGWKLAREVLAEQNNQAEDMKLELIFLDWYCDCDRFVINGKQGQVEDFGVKYDRSPDKAESGGCGNMQFTRNDSTAEVLKKYNITKVDFNTICDKLEEGLSFGYCDWCF